jgi:hypothetical protein
MTDIEKKKMTDMNTKMVEVLNLLIYSRIISVSNNASKNLMEKQCKKDNNRKMTDMNKKKCLRC